MTTTTTLDPTEAAFEPSQLTWHSLIGRTIAERARPSNRVNALRMGAHPATELAATAHTAAYLTHLDALEARGARRAAAICAKHPHVAHADFPLGKLGSSLRLLHRDATGSWPGLSVSRNQIEAQVCSLPMLDVDSAATVLDGLVRRCGEAQIGVNFYALARTLIGWGNGITPASQAARATVVVDFHTPLPAGTGTNTPASDSLVRSATP